MPSPRQGKLTEELAAAIDAAGTLAEVEILFTGPISRSAAPGPPWPGRRAGALWRSRCLPRRDCPRPEEAARDYIDPEKGVETVKDALQGASDIAEQISDDAAIRKTLRALLWRQGQVGEPSRRGGGQRYRLYYDFTQPHIPAAGTPVLSHQPGRKKKTI